MEILQEKSHIYHLNTEQYIEKINSLKENSTFILDEFKKLYVINKMHPENEEYQYQYSPQDVLDICNKLYRDELLSAFELEFFFS